METAAQPEPWGAVDWTQTGLPGGGGMVSHLGRAASIHRAGTPLGRVGTPTRHSPAWGSSSQNEKVQVVKAELQQAELCCPPAGACLGPGHSTFLTRAGSCPCTLLCGKFRVSPLVSPLKASALPGMCCSGRREILKEEYFSYSYFFLGKNGQISKK